MQRLYMIVVIFASIIYGENLKSIRNISATRKRDSNFSKAINGPVAPQPHTCIVDCAFNVSFDEPLLIPYECRRELISDGCGMAAALNFNSREIRITLSSEMGKLNFDGIQLKTGLLHKVEFELDNHLKLHIFGYACAIGDECEWKYAQEIIPKLKKLNYQPMNDALSSLLYDSLPYPNITECFFGNELSNCLSGTCQFSQSADIHGNLEKHRNCSISKRSILKFGKVRFTPGPSKYDYDTVEFTCNKEECNSQTNEDAVRRAIDANGNEFILSNATRSKLISFTLYFVCLVLSSISFL